MATHDIDARLVATVGGLLLLMVALVVAVVLAILAAWGEPWGGDPGAAAAIVPALQAAGPALQSAPQVDHAAYLTAKARERAASEAASR